MPETRHLDPFQAPLTQEMVKTSTESYPVGYIIDTLLQLSSYLINNLGGGLLFGKTAVHDPHTPSLRTLFDRLHNGQLGPSRLPSKVLTDEHNKGRVHQRTEVAVSKRPLADFEDLYYAVLSSMKETHQWLNDHVRSGFQDVSSAIGSGGETIADLHGSLSEYWKVLNSPACGKALDDAVRQAKFEALQEEIFRLVEANELLPDEAKWQLELLQTLRSDNDLDGMLFVNAWPPAMISVTLQQKYSALLKMEKEESEKQAMRKRRQQKTKPSKKEVKFSCELAVSMEAEQNKHGIYTHAQQISKETYSEADAQVLQQAHEGTQDLASYPCQDQKCAQQIAKPTLLPGGPQELNEAYTPQGLEQKRAHQDRLHRAIGWDMKRQRVSEYKNHLRARASPDVRSHMSNVSRPAERHSNTDTGMSYGDF